jgi:hypothetical protein
VDRQPRVSKSNNGIVRRGWCQVVMTVAPCRGWYKRMSAATPFFALMEHSATPDRPIDSLGCRNPFGYTREGGEDCVWRMVNSNVMFARRVGRADEFLVVHGRTVVIPGVGKSFCCRLSPNVCSSVCDFFPFFILFLEARMTRWRPSRSYK